jgi:hypothetical protein
LAQELNHLWHVGFVANGQKYRVGVISAVFDGRGLEKAMKSHGANSLTGCNLCSFPGMRFGRATVYPGYRRYLDPTDPLRRFGIPSIYPATQYIDEELREPPENFNYGRYETLAKEVACNGGREIGGVKGLWELGECGYAEYIHITTKDSMHAADNFIKDSIRVMIPNQGKFVGIDRHANFGFGLSLLRRSWKGADAKMNHIFGCPQHLVVKKIFKKQAGGKLFLSFHGINPYTRPFLKLHINY